MTSNQVIKFGHFEEPGTSEDLKLHGRKLHAFGSERNRTCTATDRRFETGSPRDSRLTDVNHGLPVDGLPHPTTMIPLDFM